jgi:DNA-binding winged helix-turn-helix (wHTH) protein/microcompartment protein CcmK/EutM
MRLQFGPVTLIPEERVLLKDGQPVSLTPKAFDLLTYLATHPGRLLTKDELIGAVWPDTVVEESNLAYNIFAIRKALGESSDGERYIETVPKRGYRFVASLVRLDADSGQVLAPEATTPDVVEPARSATGSPHNTSAAMPDADRQVHRLAADMPKRRAAGFWVPMAVGVAIGALSMALLLQLRLAESTPPSPIHFQEAPWELHGPRRSGGAWLKVPSPFQVSPDGQHLASPTLGEDGVFRIWIRSMNAVSPQPLLGTETLFPTPLFWSPDSTMIAYDATGAGTLRKVGITGGASERVCDLADTAVGGSWNSDGVIIVGNPKGGIMRCMAAGGDPAPVTVVPEGEPEAHLMPSFLGDGRRFLFLRISRAKPERSGLYVSELHAAPAESKRLLTAGFGATYVPADRSGLGVIVFGRDGGLHAQRFDERRLELKGEPIRLASQVGSYLDWAAYSASATTVVYREPDPAAQLTWFDRDGQVLDRLGEPEQVAGLTLSPDGNRVVIARHTPQNTADQDLWLYDLTRAANPRRLTSATTLELFPMWRTNEAFIYTSGGGETGIYQQRVGGDRELLFNSGIWDVPTSVTADGALMLFSTFRDPTTRADVWLYTPAHGSDGSPVIKRPFDQGQAQLSPDRHWIAYVSNETARNEVFVAEFQLDAEGASIGDSVLVSKGGGFAPRWRADGRELFYLQADGSIIAVDMNFAPRLTANSTRRLFVVPGVVPEWGISKDGTRFLFAVPVAPAPSLNIIQNWQSLLPQ